MKTITRKTVTLADSNGTIVIKVKANQIRRLKKQSWVASSVRGQLKIKHDILELVPLAVPTLPHNANSTDLSFSNIGNNNKSSSYVGPSFTFIGTNTNTISGNNIVSTIVPESESPGEMSAGQFQVCELYFLINRIIIMYIILKSKKKINKNYGCNFY